MEMFRSFGYSLLTPMEKLRSFGCSLPTVMEKLGSFFTISQTAVPGRGPALPVSRRDLTPSTSSSVFQKQDLGKVILNMVFSAVIALVGLDAKDQIIEPPISIRLLAIALLMAFSASFLAIYLDRVVPIAARAFEHIGILSTVVAFYLLMCFLLPSNYMWVVLVAGVMSLLAYVAGHVVPISASDDVIEE